ncbi:DNA cytosine methyltransferase [Vibrio barjaei]|uniref:DNA cytosine methyltransferase n=1 Tax=Vibrio barjaei TaxID=1676683 RepID=UPI0022834A9C|nr:DNA cytosine methyltransferase [Vibrio barjaei]MCY9873854.1 DNA cytosine methyltransferase [Vibrio barjaei]
MIIINTTISEIGKTTKKKRIWLEGYKLLKRNIIPGNMFNYIVNRKDKTISVVPSQDGEYKVSKRQSNNRELPVLDLSHKDIQEAFEEFFGSSKLVRVKLENNRLVIKEHPKYARIRKRISSLKRNIKNGCVRLGGLFHGGGFLDSATFEGLSDAGIGCTFDVVVEREGRYLNSSMDGNSDLFHDGTMFFESNIEDVDLDDVKNLQVNGLIAGIPCEATSQSGRSKNDLWGDDKHPEDHKDVGGMVQYYLEWLKKLNPAFLIIEQVKEYLDTASWAIIKFVLKRLDYTFSVRTLKGNDFGALENRERMVCVAVTEGLGEFDVNSVLARRTKEATFGDVMEFVPNDDPSWKRCDYLKAKEIRDAANGKNFKRNLVTADSSKLVTAGKGYAKLRSCEPHVLNQDDPEFTRPYTRNEHCSVMTVPPARVSDYASKTTVHEMIGQSIVFTAFKDVAYTLGTHLIPRNNQKQEVLIF